MISNLGYCVASAGFVFLLFLLLTVRQGGKFKFLLILAVVSNLVWTLGYNSWIFPESALDEHLTFDLLKQVSWCVFLCMVLHNQLPDTFHSRYKKFRWLGWSILFLTIAIVWLITVPVSKVYLIYTITALTLILLLVILQQQAAEKKWAFIPLMLYLVIINIFDVAWYAYSTKEAVLDANYIVVRGYVYALMIPFLFLAVRRMEHWGIKIFISRDIILHSTLLSVAVIYVFIMIVLGYIFSNSREFWNTSIFVGMIILSLIPIMILFLSSHIRNTFKVFIIKHFFANQFDYRAQWVELTNILAKGDGGISEVYQTALQGLMNSVNYDNGILCKLAGSHYQIVANSKAPPPSVPDDHLLMQAIAFLKQKSWLIDLHELQVKPENYIGLDIELHEISATQYQFILPIYRNSELWGIAVLFTQSGIIRKLNWELRDYLNAVLAQVSNYVLHCEASREVAENMQFSAFNRMSAFVVHDLKNVMAQVELILCNAQQHKSNPDFIDDTFETLKFTQSRMQNMLKQLTEKQLTSAHKMQPIDVCKIIQAVITQKCAAYKPIPRLEHELVEAVRGDSEKLSNVFYHLINNAQEASPKDGCVTIHVTQSDNINMVKIVIKDTGHGMSKTFIDECLFTPFYTTKGNAGMGIGAYDAKQYIEGIGGSIKVNSRENLGSTFTVLLPIYT